MQTMLQVSENVLKELDALVNGAPDFKGPRGSLFISKSVPAACIKLSVPKDEFLQSVMALPRFSQTHSVVPAEGHAFDIAVIGEVALRDGVLTINGEDANILEEIHRQ